MKIKRLFTILTLVICLFFVTGCKASIQKKDSVGLDKLKLMASESSEEVNINYSGAKVDLASATVVECLGSNLAVYRSTEVTLKNFALGNTIKSGITYGSMYASGFSSYNYVYANSSLPIAIYSEDNSETSNVHVYYYDPYGAIVAEENAQDSKYIDGYDFNLTEEDNVVYFVIHDDIDSSRDKYFRWELKDGKYIVSLSTKEAFDNPPENGQVETGDKYDDDLKPLYDKKGKVYGYIGYAKGTYFIYDKNKKYINDVNPESYGINPNYEIPVVGKIYLIQQDTYYESLMENGSESKYKVRCLEINLKTGACKYTDKFRYYIEDVEFNDQEDDEQFKYCYVLFSKLNRKGVKEDQIRCAFVEKRLSFGKSFIYDGFTDNVYEITKNTYLVSYNGIMTLVTKNNREKLYNINIEEIYKNGDVIYVNQNDLYYLKNGKDFANNFHNLDEGYDYISSEKYNEKRIYIKYNESTKKYDVQHVNSYSIDSEYAGLAKYGIFVTNNGIYAGTQCVFTPNDEKIQNVDLYKYLGNVCIFKVYTSAQTYYFMATEQ